MRKRVFGSIFLTALVSVILTATLLLTAVHSGLSSNVRTRLANECGYIADLASTRDLSVLREVGAGFTDRITLIAPDGKVLYDNQSDEKQMESHGMRPEIRQALENGIGQSSRLSSTFATQTYYYARRLPDGMVLRIATTADSAFRVLSAVSPWIVLVVLLTLLVAVLLASWLTHVFLAPIVALDLRDPLKNDAYDELLPLLQRMAKQNSKIDMQMRELKQRQAEFDDITERMNEGLVLFSTQGMILSANRAVCDLFPHPHALGSYLTLCRDPEYMRVVEKALSGESAHGRMKKDGRVYALAASSVAGQGQGHAAVLFVVDVTERDRAERQRQEFTANVSHELKTPLTSIMGFAEIIENGIARPEDMGRFAGKIRAEAVRLLTLIEDIIRLSQLDEGGAAAAFEAIELRALCGTVCDRLRHKAQECQVALCVSGEPVTICGQRQTLEQVVFNLVDNAIVYNRPNGSVTIKTGEENGAPFARVADTGIGIAPADQQRVFERFYRVDKSHSKMTGGTGLGLSIVKHGAALHNAEVELQSAQGEGTTITLRFPKTSIKKGCEG